jgi:hypothetical protein
VRIAIATSRIATRNRGAGAPAAEHPLSKIAGGVSIGSEPASGGSGGEDASGIGTGAPPSSGIGGVLASNAGAAPPSAGITTGPPSNMGKTPPSLISVGEAHAPSERW